MRRRLMYLVAGGVVLLLLMGHWAWWYRPRGRAEVPRADSQVAALLLEKGYRIVVWMPFPHQNLAYLQHQAGLTGEAFFALARLVELQMPKLPSFGPLAVPPASELAFGIAEDGKRFTVRARVYALFAAFARLSGRMAGNPWLAGGNIYREGQQFEVSWQGDVWSVTCEGLGDGEGLDEGVVYERALAHIRLRREASPVPAGRYRLEHDGSALEVVSAPPLVEPRSFEELALPQLNAFLFAFSGGDGVKPAPQALVFFDQEESRALELPRVAMVYAHGQERWKLPGESLLELTGQRPKGVEVGEWQVAALDQASAEAGRGLASGLGRLLTPAAGGALHWALWLDLGASAAEVSRLVYMLAQVPLVPPRQLERWRDIETVLGAVAGHFNHLTLEISGGLEGEGLRLRMEARDPVEG